MLEALISGRHSRSLREYFGARAYAELSVLAAAAAKARAKRVRKPRGPVLILPGIMGSKIGGSARSPVLWVDPLQIAAGRLTALKLPSGESLRAVGVLLFSYARLKLQLEIGGLRTSFHSYDWRLGLDVLGAQLAARIESEEQPVILVAHSMGGLVARVAARMLPKRMVRKLIMLGTPNAGSFASVQALRGTYPFVRRMARLDRRHSPEYLATKVFNTFPGLYHMLPTPRRPEGIDLFDPREWPPDGPAPDGPLLKGVAAVRANLAPADSRMLQIVGVNRETVIGLRRTAAGFEYSLARSGMVPCPWRWPCCPSSSPISWTSCTATWPTTAKSFAPSSIWCAAAAPAICRSAGATCTDSCGASTTRSCAGKAAGKSIGQASHRPSARPPWVSWTAPV